MKTILSMQDVSLIRRGKTLLSNINWEVKAGQTWAILGLNGAGKSTLLRILLAETWPSQGTVSVLGTTFGLGDIPALRKRIGIVSSFISERFDPHMQAEHLVLTGRYKSSILYTAYEESDLEEAREMLRRLGATQLIGRKYLSLSQGEKQMLLIARSLMDQPDLLILDEATSGLDLFAREKILHFIEEIKSLPTAPTILYVTHHAEEITRSMDHLLLLREGQIVQAGPKEEVLTTQVLGEFYQAPVEIIPLGHDRYFVKPEVEA